MRKLITSSPIRNLMLQGGSAIIGFLYFTMLARYMKMDIFGQYVLILSIIGLIDVVRHSAFYSGIIRFFHKQTEWKGQHFASTAQLSFGLHLIWMLLVLGVIQFNLITDIEIVRLIALVAVYLLTSSLLAPFTGYYHAQSKFFLPWLMKLLPIVGVMLVTAWKIWNGTAISIEFLIRIQVYWNLVSAFCILLATYSIRKNWFRVERNLLIQYIKFGKYTILTGIGSHLLRSSDVFLIQLFLGNSAVAIYSVAFKAVEIFEIPIRAWSIAVMPKLAHSKDNQLFQLTFHRYLSVLLIPNFILAVIVFLFPNLIIQLLAGEGYAASEGVLMILMFFTALLPLERFTGVALDVLGMPSLNSKKVFWMLVINTLGNALVLYYFQSIEMVAAVSIFTFGFGLLLGTIVLRKKFNLKIEDTFRQLGFWLQFLKQPSKWQHLMRP